MESVDCRRLKLEVDLNKLQQDAKRLESRFLPKMKIIKHWQAIALRNGNGDSGFDGLHLFQVLEGGKLKPCMDTEWMAHTEYIPQIIEQIETNYGTKVGLVRLLKLTPHKDIQEHKDGIFFGLHDGNIFRMHIPIFTNPQVKFYIEDRAYFLEPGKFYYMNVSKNHHVTNNSDQDRIHLVLDLVATPELAQLIYEGETLPACN